MIAALLLAAPPLVQAPEPDSARVSVDEAGRAAVAWLVANQHEDGTWGGHQSPRPIEVLCDVPGSHHAFRVATTALCVAALVESPWQQDGAAEEAASRGVDALIEQWDVKRPSGFEHYNVWAYGFGFHGIGTWLRAHPEDPRRRVIEKTLGRGWLADLDWMQCLDGGWGYLSLGGVPTRRPSWTSMSFTTATVLVGLDRARQAGLELPWAMVRKATASLERCRTPEGSFTYGEIWRERPLAGINRPKGAACRTPACLLALELWDEGHGADAARKALEDLLTLHPRFQVLGLRRPIPHESHYQISGYFYLYGAAYAALLMERLPEDLQRRYAPALARMVLRTREPDGSFWDYPLYSYHKPYGTGFALMALSRVAASGLEGGEGPPAPASPAAAGDADRAGGGSRPASEPTRPTGGATGTSGWSAGSGA